MCHPPNLFCLFSYVFIAPKAAQWGIREKDDLEIKLSVVRDWLNLSYYGLNMPPEIID